MENLQSRLQRHFAIAVTAVGIASASHAEVITWNCGLVVPVNFEGLYINVEAQTVGNSSTAGWDMNVYGWTSTDLYWYVGSNGASMVQGAGTGFNIGTANLAPGTVVSSASSMGTGQSSVIYGGWQLNTTNYFGFQFNAGDGTTHYGFGEMLVGGSIGVRTIVTLNYESVAGEPITVGGGGPPPAYDPCSPGNPSLSVGSNGIYMNATAADLAVTGACSFTAYKANYFKFSPPASGEYSFSTCTSAQDTRIALLDGCAAGSAVLGCNDDACGSSSSVTLNLDVLNTYYLAIGSSSAKAELASPVAVVVDAPSSPACVSAEPMVFGSNSYDCNFSPIDQNCVAGTSSWIIYKAKWFEFTPTVTGLYSISACGSYSDTKLAIGTTCPSVGGDFTIFAYNDDACACGSGCGGGGGTAAWSSALNATNSGIPLTQNLIAGQVYHVIVGTYSNGTPASTGALTIDGPPPATPCPADFNHDQVVDGLDLAVLLACWGQPCGDTNGDGTTDGLDLAVLLAAWGSCP